MDLSTIEDKGTIAYMLIQEQRTIATAQHNAQMLEQRLVELERVTAVKDAEPSVGVKKK